MYPPKKTYIYIRYIKGRVDVMKSRKQITALLVNL